MKIPDVRKRLVELCVELDQMAGDMNRKACRLAEISNETRRLVAEMIRRPAEKRAANASRPMTPELAAEVRRTAERYPDMTQHHISTLCGVNSGRVSETLRGKRT